MAFCTIFSTDFCQAGLQQKSYSFLFYAPISLAKAAFDCSKRSRAKNCKITLKVICDQIKITCSKSDLRSDQDHDLEHHNKVIGDQIVISDH